MKTDPKPSSPPSTSSNVKKRKADPTPESIDDPDVDIVGIEDLPTKKSRKDKDNITLSPSPSLDNNNSSSTSIPLTTHDLKKSTASNPAHTTLSPNPNVRSKPRHADASAPSLSDGDTNSSPTGTLDASSQKRVLPSRRSQLRDKTALPMDAAVLLGLGSENHLTPAGEYILYLAKKRVLQQTSTDAKRIPLATYGASEDETGSMASDSETPAMAPPPSVTTHIEVPIFKLCSIAQFLQEEKKRKMAVLTKALAKAEAIAEAEALAVSGTTSTNAANASQTGTGAKPVIASRTVSTRQKHKEIASHQQISILAPTSMHGKKATTTIGKKEGPRARALTTQDEDLRDEVYEKRHKKQETAEKKVKNREKEKLRHAMYQQQLVVEKLRHIEINRLMPIGAFRSLQKSVEMEQRQQQQSGSGSQESTQESSSMSLAAAKILQDKYYRRLLREAEENLRRYEQLGLGDSNHSNIANYSPFSRTKDRLAVISALTVKAKEEKQRLQDTHQASASGVRSRKRSKPPTVEPAEDSSPKPTTPTRIRTKNRSTLSPSQTPDPRSRRSTSRDPGTEEATKIIKAPRPPVKVTVTPPKPITTFFKPGSVLPSGSRKSHRVALAFGERVPILDRIDFSLPMEDFGSMIRARNGEPEIRPVSIPAIPAIASTDRIQSTKPSDGCVNGVDEVEK